jgi:hypothetical protein
MDTQGNRQTGNHIGKQTGDHRETDKQRETQLGTTGKQRGTGSDTLRAVQGCREKPMETRGNRHTGM